MGIGNKTFEAVKSDYKQIVKQIAEKMLEEIK